MYQTVIILLVTAVVTIVTTIITVRVTMTGRVLSQSTKDKFKDRLKSAAKRYGAIVWCLGLCGWTVSRLIRLIESQEPLTRWDVFSISLLTTYAALNLMFSMGMIGYLAGSAFLRKRISNVGVGMTITSHPLHGSGRALLTHPALTLGDDAKPP